jgi:hypothetical protein
MPIPPSQLSKWRHRLIERGRDSSPESTVPPVVVKPDAASKYASVKLMGRKCHSGNPATAGRATQVSATNIKPSRVLSSRLKRRVANHRVAPRANVASAEMTNDHTAGSSAHTAITRGASMVTAKTIMTRAKTCATGSKMSFTRRRRSLERAFPRLRYGGDPSRRGSSDRPAARWCRDAR